MIFLILTLLTILIIFIGVAVIGFAIDDDTTLLVGGYGAMGTGLIMVLSMLASVWVLAIQAAS